MKTLLFRGFLLILGVVVLGAVGGDVAFAQTTAGAPTGLQLRWSFFTDSNCRTVSSGISNANYWGLTAFWDAPAADGGSEITRYSVRIKRTGQLAYIRATTTENDWFGECRSVVTALWSDTLRLEVAAQNAVGTGSYANLNGVSRSTTGQILPGGLMDVSVNGSGAVWVLSADYAWLRNAGGYGVGSVIVEYRHVGASSWVVFTGSATVGGSVLVNMTLPRDVRGYQIRLRLVGDGSLTLGGQWAYSDDCCFASPVGPTVTILPGVERLDVQWQALAGETVYEVQYREVGDTQWLLFSAVVSGTDAAIMGLTVGTEYEVRVKAVSEGSLWSDIETARPLATAPANSRPDAPASVVVTSLLSGEVVVAWGVPLGGGLVITGYRVEYKLGADGTFTNVVRSGTNREQRIAGLTVGQEYGVRVRASNSLGDGDWSGTVYFVVNEVDVYAGGSVSVYRKRSLAGIGGDLVVWRWSVPEGADRGYGLSGLRVDSCGTNRRLYDWGVGLKGVEVIYASEGCDDGDIGSIRADEVLGGEAIAAVPSVQDVEDAGTGVLTAFGEVLPEGVFGGVVRDEYAGVLGQMWPQIFQQGYSWLPRGVTDLTTGLSMTNVGPREGFGSDADDVADEVGIASVGLQVLAIGGALWFVFRLTGGVDVAGRIVWDQLIWVIAALAVLNLISDMWLVMVSAVLVIVGVLFLFRKSPA